MKQAEREGERMKTSEQSVVARESQHTALERARDFRCWLLEINGPLASLADEQFRVYEETFPKSEAIAWAFKDDSHQALVEALQAAKALFAKGGPISQFDWGKSALSGTAIRELNETPAKIEQALRLAQGEK